MGKLTYFVAAGCDYNAKMAVDYVTNAIQEYLDRDEGWKPTGGIAIVKDEDGYYHVFQAIVRM